jgi:hypothetical protein
MNRLVKACLLAALCACTGYVLISSVQAGDQTEAKPANDPRCKTAEKDSTACHTPSSRTEVLKAYLTEQEKLAASASTNGVKSCDKPPSKAALMLKAMPSKK